MGMSARIAACFLGAGLLAAGAAASLPELARADCRIAVRLTDHQGRPVDGSVTLTGGGLTRTCRTTASRCTLDVPGGTYRATLRPVRGTAPAPRSVTVPASGTISLALTAGPATTVTSSTTVQSTSQPGTVQSRPATTSTVTRPAGTTSVSSTTTMRATRVTRPTTRRAATVRRTTAVTPTTRPASTSLSPSTGSSGTGGATSGGSGGTTTTPTTATAVSTTTAAARTQTQATRSLTSGRTLAVQGSVLDGAGRPTDATLTVRRGGAMVGTARTTAGRFSLYDLPAATYDVALESSRGTRNTARLTVGSTTSRVTLRVP